jgi:NAD(P)-dependent dehydrogenase (short-subunit alcohol dehydrogenase family)
MLPYSRDLGAYKGDGNFEADEAIIDELISPDNVRMNNVLPGWIDSLPQLDERRDSVPMQRYGTAEEIAATIAFLVSDGAAYITGQSIRVDGGLMRSI